MGIEIERKFLVCPELWRPQLAGVLFRQGYLCSEPERTVRVRLEGEVGKLTIKGKSLGITRSEYEYQISAAEAMELLDSLCLQPLIEKTRYQVEHAGKLWEVDQFHGDNAGLLLAEVELASETETIELPEWVGAEVSDDPRYFNANLVRHPYAVWGASE